LRNSNQQTFISCKQQFGICEHYAGHLVFLDVLHIVSNKAARMLPKAATRPDGALAAVAYTAKNYSGHLETLNARSSEQSQIVVLQDTKLYARVSQSPNKIRE
jgi:hypothetical protein